jgi:hypothetical protein
MAAQIIFFGLAVLCLFDAGFVAALAWAARSSGGLIDRRPLAGVGVMLAAGILCLIAGSLA